MTAKQVAPSINGSSFNCPITNLFQPIDPLTNLLDSGLDPVPVHHAHLPIAPLESIRSLSITVLLHIPLLPIERRCVQNNEFRSLALVGLCDKPKSTLVPLELIWKTTDVATLYLEHRRQVPIGGIEFILRPLVAVPP